MPTMFSLSKPSIEVQHGRVWNLETHIRVYIPRLYVTRDFIVNLKLDPPIQRMPGRSNPETGEVR